MLRAENVTYKIKVWHLEEIERDLRIWVTMGRGFDQFKPFSPFGVLAVADFHGL